MPASLIHEPKHWRERAEEMRAMAEQMSDPVAKQTMLGIVAGYERLAQRAEERARVLKDKD